MIFAKNRQAVGTAYADASTYRLARMVGAVKLSIRVRGEPVILQVSERVEQFFENESETEQLLEPGFHSREYTVPVTAWRFRAESEPTTVDFVAYG